jgi:hypothetical protein
MKRYRLIYRGCRDAYYCFDTHTKKRESLGINDAGEAQRLVDAKNEAVRHVSMNLQIAQVYLQHSDPTLAAAHMAERHGRNGAAQNRPDAGAVDFGHAGQSL